MGFFDRLRGNIRVGGHKVHVQLQRISAGFFDQLGVFDPSAAGDAVKTADDGEVYGFLGGSDQFKIPICTCVVVGQVRVIGDRFSKRFTAAGEEMVQGQLLVNDLFLEQRIEHNGAEPGILHGFDIVQLLG